jgi:hypothetical protein
MVDIKPRTTGATSKPLKVSGDSQEEKIIIYKAKVFGETVQRSLILHKVATVKQVA